MDRTLLNALSDFKRCAEEAPEGCHEQAKELNELLGNACDELMRGLRALGLKADPADPIFKLEAAMYDYARRSNPDATLFHSAEGFGSGVNGPARERILAQTVSNRDFLRSQGLALEPLWLGRRQPGA